MTAAPLHRDLSRPDDVLSSMMRRIEALKLDLRGLTVITEAATGAYACTAPIAAMAGARVLAVARDTVSHGRAEDAFAATRALAEQAGVSSQITFLRQLAPDMLGSCDILTNSGHLRPITTSMIGQLPPTAVIALMFEAWEFREGDLDLAACRQRGIRVAAVNERHPDIDVFSFLGPLCQRLLKDGGLSAHGAKVALLCDNPFAPFIQKSLVEAGASVTCFPNARSVPSGDWSAVVLSVNPARSPVLDEMELTALRAAAPSALLAQFWGDIDRAAAEALWPNNVWPRRAPAPGHMAVLLSELGHDPIVRLQAGGLKAAELAFKNAPASLIPIAELL